MLLTLPHYHVPGNYINVLINIRQLLHYHMQIVFNYVWKAITKYANKLITNIAIQATRKMYFPVSGIILYKKVNKEQTIFSTNKHYI